MRPAALCGERHDRRSELKEISDRFYAELREWLLAGKKGDRPQYPGAKRYGVKEACWFPGSEDWSETELKEYTHWKIKGCFDQQAAALALRGRTAQPSVAASGSARLFAEKLCFSDRANPDSRGFAAVSFAAGNGGTAAEIIDSEPVKQSFTANRAAQPPALAMGNFARIETNDLFYSTFEL